MRTGILLLFSLHLAGFAFGSSSSYFEIKLNQVSIYNSMTQADAPLKMEYDNLKETDLFEVFYHTQSSGTNNEFEMHIKVANTDVDLTFVNDEPKFALNMGWLTQFKNRPVSIYIHQTLSAGKASSAAGLKVVDLMIE